MNINTSPPADSKDIEGRADEEAEQENHGKEISRLKTSLLLLCAGFVIEQDCELLTNYL